MILYHGDDRVRAAILERIDTAIASQILLPDANEKLHAGISAVEAIVGTRDLDRFESETGMPAMFGLLIDEMLRTIADDRRAARAFVRRWFDSAPAGADLRPLATALVCSLLDRTLVDDSAPEALAMAARDVRALHRARANGSASSRAEWSAARAAALVAADAAAPGVERLRAEIAVNLAWPADRSRTILVEGVRAYASFAAAQAAERGGWHQADAEAADRVMYALWDETATERDRDPSGYEFHPIFAAQHPELSARFIAALEAKNTAYRAAMIEVANDTLTQLSNKGQF